MWLIDIFLMELRAKGAISAIGGDVGGGVMYMNKKPAPCRENLLMVSDWQNERCPIRSLRVSFVPGS